MTWVAALTALVLTAIAAVHAMWAIGSTWPASDELTLARMVVGRTGIKRMPPRTASMTVAVLLVGLAALALTLIGASPAPLPRWTIDLAGAAVTLVFLARGVAAYTPAWRRLASEQPFARLDQTVYAPLCLALGLAFLVLLLSR